MTVAATMCQPDPSMAQHGISSGEIKKSWEGSLSSSLPSSKLENLLTLNRMWERFQKLLDRVESRLALYLALGGSSAMGLITGWIASYSDWIGRFGAIGWWLTGLLGALVVALVSFCAIQLRYAWVRIRAIQEWQQTVDSFNPMNTDFNRMRIRISDLSDPISNRVLKKTITNCDLIGPANIVFIEKCNITNVGFINCDVIAARDDALIRNAIGFEHVTMTGGRIANATIIVQEAMVPHFSRMGAPFISYLKSEADLNQGSNSTAA